MRRPLLLLLLLSDVASFQSGPGSFGGVRITGLPIRHETRIFSTQEKTKVEIANSNKNENIDLASSEQPLLSYESGSSTSALSSTSESNFPSWVEPAAWRGVIVILCALWASNFAAAKLVMAEPGVDSSLYAVARFSLAFAALAPGAVASLKKANMDWETLKTSLQCGSWVAFGYLGQTLGLLSTTASRSCVICSMHCVFVAVVAEFYRVTRSQVETKYDYQRLLPAALAVIGVAIVELQGAGGAPTIGDALSFAQPIGFGMGYLTLEELMKKKPEAALPVSALKLLVVSTASFLMFEAAPMFNGAATEFAFTLPDFTPIISSPLALGGILYTGLITTAAALWIESIAFARVPATDASIILTTEPLIAALFGAVALGETFGMSDYVGATMIIGACGLAVLMDNSQEECDVGEDDNDDCEPERKRPFWSF